MRRAGATRCEAIFRDDADRVEFLRTLGQALSKDRIASGRVLLDEQPGSPRSPGVAD
jgi:hypothetical protein